MRPFRVDFCGSEFPCRPSPSRGYQRPRTPSERSWQVRETGASVPVRCQGSLQGHHSGRQEHPELAELTAECGTMLAVEAQGCDAEDAVAALANLISAESHESEDQGGEPAQLPVTIACH